MDYYTDAAGRETLTLNAQQARKIMAACWTETKELPLLGKHTELKILTDPKDKDSDDSNFRFELELVAPDEFGLHIYAEENTNMDAISNEFLTVIGELLTELRLPWWEVGVAEHATRHAPGCFGGGSFRFLCDGSLVWADEVWPIEVLQMYAKMAATK